MSDGDDVKTVRSPVDVLAELVRFYRVRERPARENGEYRSIRWGVPLDPEDEDLAGAWIDALDIIAAEEAAE